ncbi:MAG: preprotein translocase subunit YajC [Alphaproteobacteria bacterium]|nr:preprotein translocase subunit YajC [Alphaproteobacteria bacterium]
MDLLLAAAAAAAQTPAPTGAAPNPLIQLAPLVFIFVIFYFLLIRPQQQARKKHMEMVQNVRRGDTVVTAGGVVGKVTKVLEGDEVMVEIADNVVVKVLKATLTDVKSKSQPANDQ